MTKKNILVTGGAGFIGSHTVDALIKKGHIVRIIDSLEKPVHQLGPPEYLNKKAEFIQADIRNRDDLLKALNGIDTIYHFAAYQDYLPNFSKYFEVNASGTALIYEIIVERKLPIQKIIVASSQAIYGEGKYKCTNRHVIYPTQRSIEDLKKQKWDFVCPPDGSLLTPQWVNENDVIDPHNQYGISKYSQEKIALHLGKRYKIPSVALRYSIVQGERQSPYNIYSGALRVFVTHLLAGKSPIIFEDGNQIRDFVNIHDAVAANLLVLEKKGADYQAFNVGGGKKWTVLEFYKRVQKVLRSNVNPKMKSYFRLGDTRHIFSNNKKIETLGFKIKHTVDESIRSYADWIQKLPQFNKVIKNVLQTYENSFLHSS